MAHFSKKQNNIVLGAFFILLGMLISGVLMISLQNSETVQAGTLVNEEDIRDALTVQHAFRLVAKSVTPAVVNISSETVITRSSGSDPFQDFFEQFFDMPREQRGQSLGTGVIITEDGYLISNHHVVANAASIQVTLSDGRQFKARVVGTDSKTDLAVLKINAKDLPIATLGDSDAVEVGDWAIAIGNPFGLSQTFTVGVISAKGRNKVGIEDYEDFLQTDASINPGNSGGPLVNIRGEVIGINTAIASPNGGSVGIGFAIPINMAHHIIPQLKENGRVTRGWLGVYIQDLTEEVARPLKMEANSGVLISDVQKDSPAEQAGMQVGDVIISFENNKVKDVFTLRKVVANTTVGRTVSVRVIRNGKEITLKVKIREMPGEEGFVQAEQIDSDWLGMTVKGIEETENKIDRDSGRGVMIASMDRDSSAARSGLQTGDVILKINTFPIHSTRDYIDFIQRHGKDGSWLFLIKRRGHTFFIGVSDE